MTWHSVGQRSGNSVSLCGFKHSLHPFLLFGLGHKGAQRITNWGPASFTDIELELRKKSWQEKKNQGAPAEWWMVRINQWPLSTLSVSWIHQFFVSSETPHYLSDLFCLDCVNKLDSVLRNLNLRQQRGRRSKDVSQDSRDNSIHPIV